MPKSKPKALKKRKAILLAEIDLPQYRPFTRFRSWFSFRDGIYSTLERARFTYPDREFYYYHPHPERERLISALEGVQSWRDAVADSDGALEDLDPETIEECLRDDPEFIPEVKGVADVLTPHLVPVLELLERIPERLEADLEFWLNERGQRLKQVSDFRAAGIQIIGDPLQLYAHRSVELLAGSVFDTRGGPIVLDAGVRVSPFSFIEGPVYVGPGARLDDVRLTGGCVLGESVRAGGEIENSIFDSFSNKHHEGFVGHSILGRWVNLGALTTTSDLKNNYGPVRLQIDNAYPQTPPTAEPHAAPGAYAPAMRDTGPAVVDTGTIKFGSLIGDCVKTAIGTMLNTGTVLDAGSNVFGGMPPKYLPPLAWGLQGRRYETARFIADCEKIFARREQQPATQLTELIALFDTPA